MLCPGCCHIHVSACQEGQTIGFVNGVLWKGPHSIHTSLAIDTNERRRFAIPVAGYVTAACTDKPRPLISTKRCVLYILPQLIDCVFIYNTPQTNAVAQPKTHTHNKSWPEIKHTDGGSVPLPPWPVLSTCNIWRHCWNQNHSCVKVQAAGVSIIQRYWTVTICTDTSKNGHDLRLVFVTSLLLLTLFTYTVISIAQKHAEGVYLLE